MRIWAIAAIIAGLIIVPKLLRKCKNAPAQRLIDQNYRYNIEDFIADQSL